MPWRARSGAIFSLDVLGQLPVGLHHVDPHRVAAHGRAFDTAQHAAQRRPLAPGGIGVPRVLVAFGRALGGLVDLDQPRMVGMTAHHGMVLQLAEAARKGHVLGTRDVLVAKEHHAMLQQQRPDLGHQQVVLCSRAQVDVAELGADRTGQRLDMDRVAQGGRADHCGCRLEVLSHVACLLLSGGPVMLRSVVAPAFAALDSSMTGTYPSVPRSAQFSDVVTGPRCEPYQLPRGRSCRRARSRADAA